MAARQLDGVLGVLRQALDGRLGLAHRRGRLTRLPRRLEQLLGLAGPLRGARAHLGQLVAQVVQQPARLLVADRLHLHLLDARAQALDERACLVQLAPEALALERVLAQLGDPLAQLVQLGTKLRVALGPPALGRQRLLERLHPGACCGLLLGQLAA